MGIALSHRLVVKNAPKAPKAPKSFSPKKLPAPYACLFFFFFETILFHTAQTGPKLPLYPRFDFKLLDLFASVSQVLFNPF